MKERNTGRRLVRSFVIFSFLLLIFATASTTSAEKEPPPPEPTIPVDSNAVLPELVGNEVEVDGAASDRNNLPLVELNGFTATLLAPSTTVVINEFNQVSDEIEFYNLSTSAVDMSGWQVKIYIGPNVLANTYTFPTGFTLAAGAYVVLHESGDPLANTATDLYAGVNLVIQTNGGAISMIDDIGTGVDFVRWNVGIITPPAGTGWVGTNPFLPDNVFFSLGRNASSLDRDYGEDWTLQPPTYGAQNDPTAPLCIQFWLVSSGGGSTPGYTPSQSTGCPVGYFVPGQVITITAHPNPGWEVGQWGEMPATDYLGTGLVLNYTMTLDHSYLYLSYIRENPAPGSVLLVGLWGDYSYTLTDLDVPYDQINGHVFAPDWEVINRYDMVIYQTFSGEPFYINSRAANYATFLDEGGCMWVEADSYDMEPDPYAPNVPYYYFGINGFGSSYLAGTVTGTGTIFSGIGPFIDPSGEYYYDLTPYMGAEVAFEDTSGNDIGVSKVSANYTTAFITYNFNYLAQLEQAEILTTFLDTCGISHIGYDYPSNDDFDFPIEVTGLNYSNSQGALSIMQATTAGDDPILEDSSKYYHTVWYSYTPAEAELITVDTFGSDYDTVLGVWTGTRGSLSLVAVNDDYNYPSVVQSRLQFSGSAGVTYYFEVAGYSSDYGKLVINVTPPDSLLFESDFEEGNLLEWSRYNDGGGWLYVCSQGAINGNWGACVQRGDNDKRKQLIDETPVAETTFNARLNFDINSLSMGEGERFRFLQVKWGAERPFFIVLNYSGGVYTIQLNTLLDNLTKVKTAWFVLTNAPHTIEVDWQASSGPGANNGYARLYMDDVLLQGLTGLDNDTLWIDSFRVGFTSRLDGKIISGIFYVDDVATSNLEYIGLP